MKMKYYFAYGMNTNLKEMAARCSGAELVGQVILTKHKFVFRSHADIEPCEDSDVAGVLWRITPECEQSLDSLEGYPYYYEKKEVVVDTFDGEEISGMNHFIAMTYYMTKPVTESLPSAGYYNCLVEGYSDNNISIFQIKQAIDHVPS